MEEVADFGKHKGDDGFVRKDKGDDGDKEEKEDAEGDEEKDVSPGVVVVVALEEPAEDVDNEPDDKPDLGMGILGLNEDGGGGGKGGGKGFVTERFFNLFGEAWRGKDEGIDFDDGDRCRAEDVDGDVDTGEEDKIK